MAADDEILIAVNWLCWYALILIGMMLIFGALIAYGLVYIKKSHDIMEPKYSIAVEEPQKHHHKQRHQAEYQVINIPQQQQPPQFQRQQSYYNFD